MSINTAQLLAEIPLFSTMDDEERRQLRAIMRERSFQPGQVVMDANEEEGGTRGAGTRKGLREFVHAL